MSQPKRIQRQRTKGWKTPDNTVYVGRPSKWGNPFRTGAASCPTDASARILYRDWLENTPDGRAIAEAARRELRGKNLMCWCPLIKPCHADVLLEIANR